MKLYRFKLMRTFPFVPQIVVETTSEPLLIYNPLFILTAGGQICICLVQDSNMIRESVQLCVLLRHPLEENFFLYFYSKQALWQKMVRRQFVKLIFMVNRMSHQHVLFAIPCPSSQDQFISTPCCNKSQIRMGRELQPTILT